MWKKLISLNLVLVLLISMLPFGAMAADETSVEDAIEEVQEVALEQGESNEPVSIAADGNTGYASVIYTVEPDTEYYSIELNSFASNGRLMLYELVPDYSSENDGNVVTGFNTKADGTGVAYSLFDTAIEAFSTDPEKPAQLYVQYTPVSGNAIMYLDPKGEKYHIQDGLSGSGLIADDDDIGMTEIAAWCTSQVQSSGTTYYPDDTYNFASNADVKNLVLHALYGKNYFTYHYKTRVNGDAEQTKVWSGNTMLGNPLLLSLYSSDTISQKFVGWNTASDGSGDWIVELTETTPHDLYAQYETYPESAYCIIYSGVGLANGQFYDFVELDEGYGILPEELANAHIAAYWTTGYASTRQIVPTNVSETLVEGNIYTATVVDLNNYYGIVDGAGGLTANGSKYSATMCYVTSAGDLNVYSFDAFTAFSKEGGVLTGYKGSKSNDFYAFTDDIWDAMAIEADANHIAHFTAQYEEVSGDCIQYMGNGAVTADGKSYYYVDGLDFNNLDGAVYAENQFVHPDGKHFLGWMATNSASGSLPGWLGLSEQTWYMPGDAIQSGDASILYAQWGQNRVTYHYTDARTETTKIDTVVDGATYLNDGILGSVYNGNENYVFVGWNTEADGSGSWYAGEIEKGTVIDLYEQWVEIPVLGYYYILSGDLGDNTWAKIVTMTAATEIIALPVAGGVGWKRAAALVPTSGWIDEQQNIYQSGDQIEVSSGDIVLVFDPWITVSYNSNYSSQNDSVRIQYLLTSGGSLRVYGINEVFGDVSTGKTFSGWNTEADGTGTSYNESDYINYGIGTSFGLTLYAQWSSAPSYWPDYDYYPEYTPSAPSSSATTTTNPDGSTTTTVTDENTGTVVETTKFPNGVAVEITTSPDAGSEITVTVPANVEQATVVIPTEDLTATTVAVDVKIGKVIPLSTLTEDGLAVTLKESADLVLVDNKKEFSDTADSWASEGIDFVTSRELFNGTNAAAGTFSPTGDMSRSMLMTVLARLDGEDTSAGATWDEVGMEWAKENGISDGTNGNRAISREEMVTMLWRYAGSPDVDISELADMSAYSDAVNVSSWAQKAMAWAIANGIINGIDNGNDDTLAPQVGASRDMVATILMRFVEWMAK